MNRRDFAKGTVNLAIATRLPTELVGLDTGQKSDAESLPSTVAGVRLVDSKTAVAATRLSRSASPRYLFNHAIRTFLLGSLIGRAKGQRFDEELLYLACVLHDLGLTERFRGDLPFEIQGAEAAKMHLEEGGYPKDRAEIVWDGIAMHASLIGHYKRPEISLVGEGAGADVVGPDFSQITQAEVDEILEVFPRMQFKVSFLKTCADVVRKHPGGASRSFMRDVGERYVTNFHPRNFCDLVLQAPFLE